jgi:hypothetical protein
MRLDPGSVALAWPPSADLRHELGQLSEALRDLLLAPAEPPTSRHRGAARASWWNVIVHCNPQSWHASVIDRGLDRTIEALPPGRPSKCNRRLVGAVLALAFRPKRLNA